MPKPSPQPKNHPPVISVEEFSVAENSPNGTLVGTVSASDPDGDSLTYSIVTGKNGGNADGAFAINALTGQITVANGSLLDYETLQTRSLTVRVTDQAGASTQATIKVVINDVDEFPKVINLASLDGTAGFRIDGINAGDHLGSSVSSAGDVNGDGFDDLIIGAPWADPGGDSRAGSSYVVFGKGTHFSAGLDLAALNGSNGFRIDGFNVGDRSGSSVSSAGDINGDGFDDLIIGASSADPNGQNYAGQSYVIFGKAGGFTDIDLASLDPSNGFHIDGIKALDVLGCSVSSAGDVNGDGFDDLIIGAYGADPYGRNYAGESYVIFGKQGDFSESVDLSQLDGMNGFVLRGGEGFSGSSVSSAGDINGDGIDDLIIGAPSADPGGNSAAGSSYVVFGGDFTGVASLDLSTLDGTNGFRIDGVNVLDNSGGSVSSAGDVNGDGVDDLIIGAIFADAGVNPNSNEGGSYVVFGKNVAEKGDFSASMKLSELNGSNGFRIYGIDHDDYLGGSVSSAGDVNNDGYDDLIIGASYADPNGKSAAGETYVVFGNSTFSASLDVAALNGSNGFRIDGIDVADTSGSSVSSAGDINGDGVDDLIIGAPLADAANNLKADAGETYVIFGRDFTGVASISLADADILM